MESICFESIDELLRLRSEDDQRAISITKLLSTISSPVIRQLFFNLGGDNYDLDLESLAPGDCCQLDEAIAGFHSERGNALINTRFLVVSKNFDDVARTMKTLLPLCVEQGVLEFVEGYNPREFEVL